MRTIVDIPNEDIEVIDKLCSQRKISRAEYIREALHDHTKNQRKIGLNTWFAAWKKKRMTDEELKEIREEWGKK